MVPQCDAVGGEERWGGEGASSWEADVLSCQACSITLPHTEITGPYAGVLHLGLTAVC